MVRPTDRETVAVGNVVCYSQFPRRGATWGSIGAGEEAEGMRVKVGRSLYCSFGEFVD